MCGMRKYEIRVYGASLCTVHERRRMHKNKSQFNLKLITMFFCAVPMRTDKYYIPTKTYHFWLFSTWRLAIKNKNYWRLSSYF